MLMSNFRINVLETVQAASGCLVSHFFFFCDFCKLIIVHPVYTISPCSCPDYDSSYDILDLADVADVFVANSIPEFKILRGINRVPLLFG